jgi:succinyl-CoA synthetase beta subunit
MSENIDTEASTHLRIQPETITRTAQTQRAERLKEWFKIVLVAITVGFVLINLWASIRKGEDIADASSAALAGIARTAALEEIVTQWKNRTALST